MWLFTHPSVTPLQARLYHDATLAYWTADAVIHASLPFDALEWHFDCCAAWRDSGL